VATRSSSGSAIQLRQQRVNVAPRRKAPGVSSKKHEAIRARLASLRKRATAVDTDTKAALVSIGVPAVVAMLGKKHKDGTPGFKLPTFAGVNPNLLWGAALALGGPRIIKGENGKLIAAAGVGLAAVGASESATAGTVLTAAAKKKKTTVGDDEIGDDEIGDDEIGDDEIGDDEG
jgi:hypothetical protein